MARLAYVPQYICTINIGATQYHGIGRMGADNIGIIIPIGYLPYNYVADNFPGANSGDVDHILCCCPLDSNDYDIVKSISAEQRSNYTDMMLLAQYYPEYWGRTIPNAD